MNKKILVALDVGTKCGVATFGLEGELLKRYTFVSDRGAQAQNLFNLLRGFLTPNMVVAWEQPFGIYGAQVTQRMVGAILCACELIGCDDVPVNLITVKKHATGDGRASKEMMIAAAEAQWGGEDWDEHQADAAWVGLCAQGILATQQEENVT